LKNISENGLIYGSNKKIIAEILIIAISKKNKNKYNKIRSKKI